MALGLLQLAVCRLVFLLLLTNASVLALAPHSLLLGSLEFSFSNFYLDAGRGFPGAASLQGLSGVR